MLRQARTADPNSYDALWRLAKFNYYLATHTEGDEQDKAFREGIDAGKAAYKASQTRNQETVSDVSNQLADACLHCHEVYRDKPGGTIEDPSNKAARCF